MLGWDAVQLSALAARQAKSTDQDKMMAALEHLNVQPRDRTYLAVEEYRFTPTAHIVSTPPGDYSFVPSTPFNEGMLGGR